MNLLKRITWICMLLLGLPLWLLAQEPAYPPAQDVIYLKNWSVYRGKIVDVKEDRSIVLELEGGVRIEFKASEIQKVVQESPYDRSRQRKTLADLSVKGWNGDLLLGLNAAQNDNAGITPGVSLHGRVGYQWNSWLGTGLLFGIEKFAFQTWSRPEEILLPLMLDIHTYPFARDSRWFAAVGGGYTPAFLLSQEGNASGGWTVFPRVGVRFPMQGQSAFTVDFGYRVQQSVIESNWGGWWGWQQNATTRMLYQRFNIRLGFQFW
jgi:hypothetical protein